MENLYGDIISDLAAGLVGGLGLVPGANLGENCAVFEATHGSWPEGAGKGLANPTAFILTSAMMMRHLGEDVIADRIESAIQETYPGRRDCLTSRPRRLGVNDRIHRPGHTLPVRRPA